MRGSMSGRAQVFYAEDAERHGIAGAVMLQHFRLWLEGHVVAGRNIHDGEVWNYATAKKVAEVYPYWTEKQARTILAKLVEAGALKKGCYNQNGYDRTLWYTVPGFLAICRSGQDHSPKRANGNAQEGEPIPESYQGRNQEPTPPMVPHEIESAFSAYNEMAQRSGLPKAQRLTESRRKKLRRRLADAGGIEGWQAACEKVGASRFCCGQNDRGWVADLDFMLQESSFTKLMEGKYDNRGGGDDPGAVGERARALREEWGI